MNLLGEFSVVYLFVRLGFICAAYIDLLKGSQVKIKFRSCGLILIIIHDNFPLFLKKSFYMLYLLEIQLHVVSFSYANLLLK